MSRADDFEQQGFLVLPGFVPAASCDALKAHTETLVAGFPTSSGRHGGCQDATDRSHRHIPILSCGNKAVTRRA